jgi:23S rRNA pseudouridine955/2504/2580 synthase
VAGVQFWRVSEPEAGQKLLQFLRRRSVGDIPIPALQRWIRTGQVRVDGARAKPGTRLEMGQEVRIPPHTREKPPPPAMSLPATPIVTVVYEDPNLLVLAKPGGLPVHPGTGHTDSITTWLHARFAASLWTPTPVHRLDRDTSGLLIVAKTYAQLRNLHDLWRSKQVCKAYLAWVHGFPNWPEPVMISDLARKTKTPSGERILIGEGKACFSLVRAVTQIDTASLVLVAPISGRTHQIRVQLSSRGHPLIGDRKYGGPICPQGMLLHAWCIQWPGKEFDLLPPWRNPWSVQALTARTTLRQMTRDLLSCMHTRKKDDSSRTPSFSFPQ